MCVAIFVPAGLVIPNDKLWAGWSRNSDGGGFAYVREGEIHIAKGFMKYNEFQRAYAAAVEANPDSPFSVHMRVRSAGAKNEANTHPFPVKDGALIHNGTMFSPTGDKKGPDNDRWSDTRAFAVTLHDKLDEEGATLAKDKLETLIGNYNKIVLLYKTGKHVILNEKSGIWEDGIWYSNSYSCKPATQKQPDPDTCEVGSGTALIPNPNAV